MYASFTFAVFRRLRFSCPVCSASVEDTRALASAILTNGTGQLISQYFPGFISPGQVSLRVNGDRSGSVSIVFSCHEDITTRQAGMHTCNFMIPAHAKSLKRWAFKSSKSIFLAVWSRGNDACLYEGISKR